MKTRLLSIAAALGILIGWSTIGSAQNNMPPGQKMHMKGSKKGEPGASGYAPGHVMQQKGSKKGHPGASGYAPGHRSTTGFSGGLR